MPGRTASGGGPPDGLPPKMPVSGSLSILGAAFGSLTSGWRTSGASATGRGTAGWGTSGWPVPGWMASGAAGSGRRRSGALGAGWPSFGWSAAGWGESVWLASGRRSGGVDWRPPGWVRVGGRASLSLVSGRRRSTESGVDRGSPGGSATGSDPLARRRSRSPVFTGSESGRGCSVWGVAGRRRLRSFGSGGLALGSGASGLLGVAGRGAG